MTWEISSELKKSADPISTREPASNLYVDNSIDETALVRNKQDTKFNVHNLTNINCTTLNTQAVNKNQFITEAYVDHFHHKNERSRMEFGYDFYNESRDLVKITRTKTYVSINYWKYIVL